MNIDCTLLYMVIMKAQTYIFLMNTKEIIYLYAQHFRTNTKATFHIKSTIFLESITHYYTLCM